MGEYREQALFDEKFLSQYLSNRRIPVDCRDKKRELERMSLSADLQACMSRRDYQAIVLFTAVDVKFLFKIDCCVVYQFRALPISIRSPALGINLSR